jgi:hypothetical protein
MDGERHVVRAAIAAIHRGDWGAWADLFEPDAKLYDGGKRCDFDRFSRDALAGESFASVEFLESSGLEVRGLWRGFWTYFRFHLSTNGKIHRLDVVQLG